MPDSVIRSTEQAAVVAEMLLGVPIPESLDVDELASTGIIVDRYQLGALVTGAVGCAWAEQWATAISLGDSASAAEAAEAMATSHGWAVLDDMKDEGDWPQAFRIVADRMSGNAEADARQSFDDFYVDLLGCK